jgi:hypothetical protein
MRYLLLLPILMACTTRMVVGKYTSSDASARITLRADSTFAYQYRFSAFATFHAEGRWKVSGRHLLLTSDVRSADDLIRGVESHNPRLPEGARRIALFDEKGKPADALIVPDPPDSDHINGGMSNFSPAVNLQKPVHRVALLVLGSSSKFLWYTVKDTTANDLALYIRLSATDRYRYFDNQPWTIARDRLTDTALHKKEVFHRLP